MSKFDILRKVFKFDMNLSEKEGSRFEKRKTIQSDSEAFLKQNGAGGIIYI